MSTDRPLLLAVDLDGDGAHPAAWRASGRAPGAVLTAGVLRAAAAAAEAAGFTLATFDDTPVPPAVPMAADSFVAPAVPMAADSFVAPAADGGALDAAGRIEAGTRAAFVSTLTDRIGLAPTLHATTTEPFHLATQLASLDHASRGRAAWVVGAAADVNSRATIGAAPLPTDALRQEVVDVIDAARLLWDSWEDDAVIKDVATGRYVDPDRVHHVDFVGSSFSIKGPLITPRPPQGQVVVITPDHLRVDDRADIVLIAATDLTALRDRADQARAAGAPLVFADLEILLDAPDRPAAARAARLDEATPWPETSRLRHVGSAEALVALLQNLNAVVDGVRFLPAVHAIDVPLVVEQVLPVLTTVGVHRPPISGATLRESLGLPRPADRFATAARS